MDDEVLISESKKPFGQEKRVNCKKLLKESIFRLILIQSMFGLALLRTTVFQIIENCFFISFK